MLYSNIWEYWLINKSTNKKRKQLLGYEHVKATPIDESAASISNKKSNPDKEWVAAYSDDNHSLSPIHCEFISSYMMK